MRKILFMPIVLGLTLAASACGNPDYRPDPSVAICNVGGPLTARQRIIAMEPKPQAVPGRPIDCQVGPDGIMRLYPPGAL